VFTSLKGSCFAGDYDIGTKNLAYQKIREAENVRLRPQIAEKRLADEKDYNKKCRMEQTSHILQMEANA
jgi:hypothetical protein